MEGDLPEENKASDPRGARHNGSLVENKPYNVNKQKMNGAHHEAGIWERSGFQAFYGSSEEARVIHVPCQMRPCQSRRLKWHNASVVCPTSAGSLVQRASLSPGTGSGQENKPDPNLSPAQPLPGSNYKGSKS